jgi:hypothetical protein
MIDKAKLEALDMVTLSALRNVVSEILHRKMRQNAYKGYEVLSSDERRGGRQVRIRITDAGPVNLVGYMIDENGNHLTRTKWRISPSLATVVPNWQARPQVPKTPLRTAADRPASAVDTAF